MYRGDGGSNITSYVIEWDLREDFAKSMKATTYDMTSLSFLIGGRDVVTGKVQAVLQTSVPYYIRVTAFNSEGAGDKT